MAKYLRITMPDKSQWDVPAQFIAEDRARYHASRDVQRGDATDFDAAFAEEVAWVLAERNGEEILDWSGNNMNWSDVAHLATLAVPAPDAVDFEEGWANGCKKVIEK